MDKPVKFGPAIQANAKVLQYVHDVTSLVYGTSAGILQFESIQGFSFFLISNFTTSLLYLILVVGFNKQDKYYEHGLSSIFLTNFSRSLTAYLMMWTLFYALIQS